jgi:two-component system chemotaxis response regulator CheB
VSLSPPDDAVLRRNIVVIGASAGGVDAIATLLRALPPDTPASFFVVSHVLPESQNHLVATLNASGPFTAKHAQDGEELRTGFVYVAPADHHLLVKREHVRVTRGPRENRWRPAIDPLFRSAAVAYGPRVIAVVLSGMLDDGTSGLVAVKRCGGIAIVQDPDDAAFAEMPRTAIANVEVDHVLRIDEMPEVIARLVDEPAEAALVAEPPRDIVVEARIAETGYSDERSSSVGATLTALSCPECGGPLWQRSAGNDPRYRCRVGHAYGAASLLSAQDEALEASIWAAVRLLDQRANVLTAMAERDRTSHRERMGARHEALAAESRNHADVLRKLLTEQESAA